MSQRIAIHPETPQPRQVLAAAEAIRRGAVTVLPVDSGYALACRLEDKNGVERIRRIRRVDEEHPMTLMCRDLSEIGTYAKLDNAQYRFLKAHTPGAYTFILDATREVPRRLQHPKRRSLGLRVPEGTIVRALLDALDEPILVSSLALPDWADPLDDPDDFPHALTGQVDLVIDGGFQPEAPSTIIDMTGDRFRLVRAGQGPVPPDLEDDSWS
ncbi:MAG: L-threonylcarbamoyladenylate synthase [Halothiobacillaceae bacterium]